MFMEQKWADVQTDEDNHQLVLPKADKATEQLVIIKLTSVWCLTCVLTEARWAVWLDFVKRKLCRSDQQTHDVMNPSFTRRAEPERSAMSPRE